MKILLIFFISIFMAITAFAQNARFIYSGTIEFEKRANVYALKKRQITKENESVMLPAYEDYKQKHPQFKISNTVLVFSGNQSVYKPQAVSQDEDDQLFGSTNIINTDLRNGASISQKKAFNELFSIKDSLRKINWKITDEEREIAGFTCRRANAIIMDSIYVVAFYTIEIPMRGGPEAFSGLPGMILGVALPHDNLSWFAIKVNDMAISKRDLTTSVSGKPTNYKDYEKTLKKSFELMRNAAQPILISLLL